jgi:hypothetical protein
MSTDVGPVASAVRAPRVMMTILRAPTRQIRRFVAPLLAPQASHPWSCERVDDIAVIQLRALRKETGRRSQVDLVTSSEFRYANSQPGLSARLYVYQGQSDWYTAT